MSCAASLNNTGSNLGNLLLGVTTDKSLDDDSETLGCSLGVNLDATVGAKVDGGLDDDAGETLGATADGSLDDDAGVTLGCSPGGTLGATLGVTTDGGFDDEDAGETIGPLGGLDFEYKGVCFFGLEASGSLNFFDSLFEIAKFEGCFFLLDASTFVTSIRPSEFGVETDNRTGLEVYDNRLEVDDDRLVVDRTGLEVDDDRLVVDRTGLEVDDDRLVVDRAGLEVDGDRLGVEEVDGTGLDVDCLEEATTAA